MEGLLSNFNMVTIPHEMVGLERMSDYRGVRLERFHCTYSIVQCEKGSRQTRLLQDSIPLYSAHQSFRRISITPYHDISECILDNLALLHMYTLNLNCTYIRIGQRYTST